MRLRIPVLYLTVLVISTCGLVYELLAATLASYVLGDSVTQFSTTIGAYLFAMGIGSYASRFIEGRVAERFIEVELATALLGGFSAPVLFLAFAYAERFTPILYGMLIVIGTLVGLEIPLLMRILKDELDFKELVARVLTFDYIGALLGSLLFAVLLVPRLGLDRTSLLFGMLNAIVGLMATFALGELLDGRAKFRLRLGGLLILLALGGTFAFSKQLTELTEQNLYSDPIIHTRQSPYQRIVVTRGPHSTQLFLNGNLQFSSLDEYRYHEALVHPVFASAEAHKRVLILGGGDGLALREVYRHPEVESVTLVDLDAAVTETALAIPALRDLVEGALADPRTELVHADAMTWLAEGQHEPYDVVIIDFPDPNNFSLGKLYSRSFYRLVTAVLDEDSALVVQSTSPLVARKSFWCIAETMREAGLSVHAYHANVPSFGDWGYALARLAPFEPPRTVAVSGLRYLDDATLRSLFIFGPDTEPVPVETNRLNDQRLVHYYEEEWARWN